MQLTSAAIQNDCINRIILWIFKEMNTLPLLLVTALIGIKLGKDHLFPWIQFNYLLVLLLSKILKDQLFYEL